MDSFATAFARELKTRIDEHVEREREALELGAAIKSLDDYRERVGRLFAYRNVVDTLMAEAEDQVQNPKPKT